MAFAHYAAATGDGATTTTTRTRTRARARARAQTRTLTRTLAPTPIQTLTLGCYSLVAHDLLGALVKSTPCTDELQGFCSRLAPFPRASTWSRAPFSAMRKLRSRKTQGRMNVRGTDVSSTYRVTSPQLDIALTSLMECRATSYSAYFNWS